MIRAWILQGASSSATKLDGVSVRAAEPALEPVGDYTALIPEIQKLQQGQGAKLTQVSKKPGDGLILATVDAPDTFTDAQLEQFDRFAPYLVEANLARTAITDRSLDTLAKFSHQRALHLEGTNITGAGLEVPHCIYTEVPPQGAVWHASQAPGRGFQQVGGAEGVPN